MNQFINKEASKIKSLIDQGFFHIFVGNILIKFISFFTSIIIVRMISKENYAYFIYSNNLYAYITLFSGFGLATALLKYCSIRDDKGKNKAFLLFSLKYGVLAQLILSSLILVYIHYFEVPFPEAKSLVSLMFLTPTMSYVVEVIQNFVRANGKNKLYSFIAVIQTVSILIFTITFVYFYNVYGIPLATYLAFLVSILIGFSFIKKEYGKSEKKSIDKNIKKAFIMMGISLMIANFFSMILPINELTIISSLIKDEIVTANYKVGVMIPSQIGFITGSAMIFYFPILAKMRNNSEIINLALKIQFYIGLVVLVVSLIGFILSPFIINYLYGNEYYDSVKIQRIFWIVNAINAGFRMIPLNIMPALGRVRFNALISIFTAIVHLFLSYIFISRFGIDGAAYSLIIVYTFSGIISWYYLIRLTKNSNTANIIN